jgi:hypothetical protein
MKVLFCTSANNYNALTFMIKNKGINDIFQTTNYMKSAISDNKLKAYTQVTWGQFYQSQGLFNPKLSSNDCGPTCVAMVLNIILFLSDHYDVQVSKKTIIDDLRPRFWERLPDWLPLIGGATAPWGLANSFNRLAHKMRLDWRARRISHGYTHHISSNLGKGNLISFLRIWENGGAHWSNVMDFSLKENSIILLDPSPYLEHIPQDQKIQFKSWKVCRVDWCRQAWWARLLGLKNELIIYTKTC